jgi:phosphoribosylformylglycinamidine synthase
MGLVVVKDIDTLQRIADRERSPMYQVGDVTGDRFVQIEAGDKPMDFALETFFGSSPKVVMTDKTIDRKYPNYNTIKERGTYQHLQDVLQLEAVACRNWIVNKSTVV